MSRPASAGGPARNPDTRLNPHYLAWIRQQPCAILLDNRCLPPSEAAHTHDGTQGTARKAQDRNAIPLCARCHRLGPTAYHVIGHEDQWLALHGLDLDRLRQTLRERYRRETGRTV